MARSAAATSAIDAFLAPSADGERLEVEHGVHRDDRDGEGAVRLDAEGLEDARGIDPDRGGRLEAIAQVARGIVLVGVKGVGDAGAHERDDRGGRGAVLRGAVCARTCSRLDPTEHSRYRD